MTSKHSTYIKEYNEERPHDSPNDLTPREYLTIHKKGETLIQGATKTGRITIDSSFPVVTIGVRSL